ncbi:hypothetical protein ISS86_02525 [Candidatus Microgenomates bacterium]|nr:hypothetical protein [Candidatus Microgenomates bacterium]
MKDCSRKLNTSSGQTTAEILLAIGIIALVLVGLTKTTTMALRNAQFAKNKSLATKYGQETLEVIRAYRDQNDWDAFKTSLNCSPAFSALPVPFDNPRSVVCDCYEAGDPNPVVCTDVDVDKVEITVNISWDSGDHEVELATFLSKWER